MWDVKWESSDPDKAEMFDHGYAFGERPCKGSVTFTTKLGNETFSFILEYDVCPLPGYDY